MSEIRANTISDAAGTGPATLTGQSAAKVWLKYDQATTDIDASFNTSSVTDTATGNYYQNMTSSFSSADYSTQGCSVETNDNATTTILGCDFNDNTASQCRWWNVIDDSGPTDTVSSNSIHGDLA